MPDQVTVLFGTTLMIAILSASHPMSNHSAAALEARISERWHDLTVPVPCTPDTMEHCAEALPGVP